MLIEVRRKGIFGRLKMMGRELGSTGEGARGR